MRLSKRISALCDAVRQGEKVADIGTDHGYVPMLLVKSDKSPDVIMSDISAGSLAKAVETFRACGIELPADRFRLGDGLSTIAPGETDAVIIGGLGGHTIADILAEDIDRSKSFKRLIMQPRKHSGSLRYFLYTRGFDITEEILVKEGKFVCEIIVAVPLDIEERAPLYPENDIRWSYPKSLEQSDRDLLSDRIGWKISAIEEELDNLSRSSKDNNDLIVKLKSDLDYLKSFEL